MSFSAFKETIAKRKIWLAVLGALLIFVVLQILGAANVKTVYEDYSQKSFTLEAGESVVLADNVQIPVGVNDFIVYYSTEGTPVSNISVEGADDPGIPVKANIQTLLSGYDSVTLRCWLIRGSRPLRLKLNAYGPCEIVVEGVKAVSTRGFWKLGSWVFLGLFLAGLAVYKFVTNKGRRPGDYAIVCALFLIIAVSSHAFMNFEGTPLAGDFGYHSERITGLIYTIRDCVFPMRLQANFPYGYGYADGLMYGYTLLFVPAVLFEMGLPFLFAINLFYVFLNALTTGVAYYSFRRIFSSRVVGVICAGVYTLSMYRVTVFIGRGCVGEACAMSFFPLLLYGYYLLFSDDFKGKRSWIIIAIGYSGVFQSHAISFELAALWTFVTCLVFIKRVFNKDRFVELLKAAGLTVGLNMWFLVPFLDSYINEDFNVKHRGMQLIQSGGMYWSDITEFIHEGTLWDEVLERNIRALGPGIPTIIAAVLFFIVAFIIRRKKSHLRTFSIYLTILGCLGVVFASHSFPWDAIQGLNPVTERLVSSILIPTRFMNTANVMLIVCWGYLAKECLDFVDKKPAIAYVGLGVVVVLVGVQCYGGYRTQENLADSDVFAEVYDINQVYGYISGGEYVNNDTELTLPGLSDNTPKAGTGVTYDSYKHGDLKAELTGVSNNAGAGSYVEVPLFNYRFFRATAGDGERLTIESGTQGVIRVLLPAEFTGDVNVRYVSPIHWGLSEIITVLTVLFMIYYFVAFKKENE